MLLNDAYHKGLESGKSEDRMEGISALIEDNIDEGIPKERILQKLQKKFNLSEEEAQEYWKRMTAGM